jgi:hypothetical protein
MGAGLFLDYHRLNADDRRRDNETLTEAIIEHALAHFAAIMAWLGDGSGARQPG